MAKIGDNFNPTGGAANLLLASGTKRIVTALLCGIGAGVVTVMIPDSEGLTEAGRRMLFIALLAGALWMTDSIPAFAVGILVIALQVALLGMPGGVFAQTDRDWEQFVSIIGHPLVWLFFGGFVLAAGMSKAGVDKWIATIMIGEKGGTPNRLLASLMFVAFVLSMLMSNTAATAMLLAILLPALREREQRDLVPRGLLLGLAIAANLGGMASLIGTPPNAIAVGNLAALNPPIRVSFLRWMVIGLPIGMILAVISYYLLAFNYFRGEAGKRRIILPTTASQDEPNAIDRRVANFRFGFVVLTLLATVAMWMTTSLHGIPTAVIAFFPMVAFTCSGVLREDEIRGLPFDVLFLLAGGLALGQGLSMTGLSTWLVSWISVENAPLILLATLVAYASVILSNFMSNTAAANLIIPLGLTLAAGTGEAVIAIPAAIAASAAMCLPVSTPPGAMVFSQGRLTTGDILRVGVVLGTVTPIVATFWVYAALWLWPL